MNVQNCALCGSVVRLVQINLTEAINICMNTQCLYPFNDSSKPVEIVNRDVVNMHREVECDKKKELESPDCEKQIENDNDFLEDFFANCESEQMTEEDIQHVDSVFEALLNCDTQV